MKNIWFLTLLLTSSLAAQPQAPGTVQIGPSGTQIQGENGSMEVGPGGTTIRRNRAGKRRWSQATLTRGSQGELILSDPQQGQIVMERGPQGKTRVQLKGQSLTVDNDLLLQWSEGQDVILEQLLGR